MPTHAQVRLNQLAYVILYVKDASKALPFYRDTLGMEVLLDDGSWIELAAGATKLALHSGAKHEQKPPDTPVLCFQVDDVYETFEALKAKGVKFSGEPKVVCETPDAVGKSADFCDAEGNRFSIWGYCDK